MSTRREDYTPSWWGPGSEQTRSPGALLGCYAALTLLMAADVAWALFGDRPGWAPTAIVLGVVWLAFTAIWAPRAFRAWRSGAGAGG